MASVSISFNRVTSGQVDASALPRVRPFRDARVIYLHTAGTTGAEVAGSTSTATMRRVVAALADRGFPFAAPTSGVLWGNATSQGRTTTAKDWLSSAYSLDTGPVALVGCSMGALSAFVYAAANPSDVACIVAILPIVDLEKVRTDNIFGHRAAIDAAWGVTYPAALPQQADPKQNTAALSAIPMQLWYASDDPISFGVADFIAATGAEGHDVGALGHDDDAIAAVDVAAVAAFLGAHA